MSNLALYREWRPKVFDEVVEQKHAVYALRQSVISGQIAHAYLFSGTRGTGKTTLAKIFARAINCLQPQNGNPCNQCAICRGMFDGSLMDIVEMDAASNNSVDNIRRLCDEIVFMPAQARYKVYIIDEVHMLSTGAFNALLKTLEEPPAHAVFILATTEPHRIPATILSRCQRYEFRRIPVGSMTVRLEEISRTDGIDVSQDALQAIASLSDGAMRDAISLLDQAHASFAGKIERDDILSLAGVVQDEFMQQTALALVSGDAPSLLELIDQLVMAGRDLARFITDLAQFFRNVLVCQVAGNPQLLVRASSDALTGMKSLAALVTSEQLIDLIKGLSALLSDLRWAADARTALEIGLIRLMGQSSPSDGAQRPAAGQSASAATADRPAAVHKTADPTPAAKQPDTASAIKTGPADIQPPDEPGPAPSGEPESAPLPEPEPEPAVSAEPEPQPVPAGEQTAVLTGNMPAEQDAVSIWQKILDELMAEGHMTLYLFGRPAQPSISGDTLRLVFAPSDQVNYNEIQTAAARKIMRSIASRLAGRDMAVQPILAGSGIKADTTAQPTEGAAGDWIDKIKKTADTLGIPVKVEE